jgi:hypothetical protein
MLFNINGYVKVKLTTHGWDIINKHSPYLGATIKEKDGWSEWQLWHLMSIFGEHIYLGGKNPFETTIDIKLQNERKDEL